MEMGTAMNPNTLRALAPQSGTTSDIAQAQADLLYDSQMEIIRKLPGLNVVTTDVVVAAGGLGVLLPADLMEQQVQSVRWNEPTFPERHLRRIEITTRRDLEDTSGGWSNPLGEANATAPTWTDEWPRDGYFDREDNGTAAYLRLIPKPSAARTVTVTYRARLVPYTVADMTAVTST